MGNGAAVQQRAAPSTAVATVEQALGTYDSAEKLKVALDRIKDKVNLVGPITGGVELAAGVEVALSMVPIDVKRETYKTGGNDGESDDSAGPVTGKRGLAISVLSRIAAAMRTSWDMDRSRRQDDGLDPHYCHYIAEGYYRSFDGQLVRIGADKEMDLREGSPQVKAIVEQCVRKIRANLPRGSQAPPDAVIERQGREKAENQIRMMRLHILGHAQSKAQLRAIRHAFGIRASYDAEELEKPFLIMLPLYTARSDDPETQRMMNEKVADAFLGATSAAYGPAQRALPPPRDRVIDVTDRNRCGSPAPAIGSIPVADDDGLPEPEPQRATPPAAAQQQAEQPRDQAPFGNPPTTSTPPPAGAIDTTKVKMPGKKGAMVADADEKDLTYWGNKIEADLNAGNCDPKFVESNRRQLAAIDYELARRKGIQDSGGQLPLSGDDAAAAREY